MYEVLFQYTTRGGHKFSRKETKKGKRKKEKKLFVYVHVHVKVSYSGHQTLTTTYDPGIYRRSFNSFGVNSISAVACQIARNHCQPKPYEWTVKNWSMACRSWRYN
ncbi:hypothetical protein CEXT_269421 [Caerostris extrusa]|uniref:Uncharacterized protein n=1 Tax=Caerostris extrusa TaxID=172846 RepID=A0AAV4SFQ6_CAEEX|nr:hypothetical protein CEXT_269421 [Caerostris extrusa]